MSAGAKKRLPPPLLDLVAYCWMLGWLSTPPLLLKFSCAEHVLELLPVLLTAPGVLVLEPLTNVSVGACTTCAMAGTAAVRISASAARTPRTLVRLTTFYLPPS